MEGNGGGAKIGSTGTIDLSPRRPREADGEVDLTGNVHHLPCCVKLTGPSDVSHYFKPKSTGIEVDGLAVEEAFFRGRKLQGVTVPLPEGYSGFVLGKSSSNDKAEKTACISNGCGNSWEMLAKCESMTFWNHDSLPSQDDTCLRLFHWFAVAKALHEPVSTENLTSEDENSRRR